MSSSLPVALTDRSVDSRSGSKGASPGAKNPHLHVVTGGNEDYRDPLAVTISSLLMNLAAESAISLYVLDCGIRPATRRRLAAMVRRLRPAAVLSWLPVDTQEYTSLRPERRSYISLATYARLRIPDLLPDLSRALYLDADLVVDTDLAPLWAVSLGGHPLGAVQDSGAPVVGARYGIRSYRALGLSADSAYFNAGVLLMDLTAWRTEGVSGQVMAHMTTYQDELQLYDQEGLNAVLCDRWQPLDFRWNLTTEFFLRDARIPRDPLYEDYHRAAAEAAPRMSARPAVIHYTSSLKPWHGTSPHPMSDRYFAYLRRSGWMTWPAYLLSRSRVGLLAAYDRTRVRSRGLRHQIGLRRPG
jgi:lipopolysaccharide biosynthesis glycosyltransferase